MTPAVSVGVVGCAGYMSQAVHMPLLAAINGVRITAACDIRGEAGEQVATRFGAARFTTDPMLVLQAPDIKAVLVLTPPWEHAWMTAAALRSGTSVFVEKPLCLSSGDAIDLTSRAEERHLVLQVGYMKQFDPICHLAQRVLRTCAGELGDLESFDVDVRLGRWRDQDAEQLSARAQPAGQVPDGLGLPEWVATADRSMYFTLLSAFSHDLNLVSHLLRRPIVVRSARFTGGSDEAIRGIEAQLTAKVTPGALHFTIPRAPAPWVEFFLFTFGRGTVELHVGAPLVPGAQSTLQLTTDRGTRRWTASAQAAFDHQLRCFVSQLASPGRGARPSSCTRDLQLAEQIYAKSRTGVASGS